MTETPHANIYVALCAAQSNMGKVVKGATNPAFKSKYADLADVVAVAVPALSAEGIAMFHSMGRDDHGPYMRTSLVHGASDTSISCDVPLIVSKNDMQGMKSATTYAKRIGLESLTGIAPDDDDGNAAAKAAPVEQQAKPAQAAKSETEPKQTNRSKACALADEMINAARKFGAQAVTAHANYQRDIAFLETASPDDFERVIAALNPPAIDDEIPYER
jgi:hypothetical protein